MIEEKDIRDVRLSRPVAVVDLWDIDDRVEKLEKLVETLQKAILALEALYREERLRNWELILREMIKREEKKGDTRCGILKKTSS
jgi:hypothetical protein